MKNKIKNEIDSCDNQQLTIVITISKLLKISEAAEFLNMSESSLQELLAKGEIPFIELNGEVQIREYELWDWMYKQNPIMIKNENPALDIFAN